MKEMAREADEYWVFGYGSLMWRPDFPYLERLHARIHGYHRSLCVYSHIHRGTPQRPGLVLGLDRGGACRGVAFRIETGNWPDTLAYLRAREQGTGVYLENRLALILADGRRRTGIAYVVDRQHHQYAGRLEQAEMARLVRQGHGQSGPNCEYVLNTCAHLADMGVYDAPLAALATVLTRSGALSGPTAGPTAGPTVSAASILNPVFGEAKHEQDQGR